MCLKHDDLHSPCLSSPPLPSLPINKTTLPTHAAAIIGSTSDRELQRALRRQKGFTFGEYRKQVQEDVERTGRKVGLLPHFRLTKRNRDHRVGSSRTRRRDLFGDEREGEEMYRAGVSTELVLFRDPWKIKKRLTESDLGHSSRLLIPRSCVETHVLPEMVMRVGNGDGMKVAVRDADTGDEYVLVFRYWLSSKSYVLNGGWNRLFVRRRGLQVGDEIGMLWDPVSLKFHFKVLRRVARHDR